MAASDRSPLLRVERLSVSYGKVEAVHGISLSVPEAAIVTVIGPNGAGKTTLLSAIMGLLPSRGVVEYEGANLERLSVEERVSAGVVLVPEKRELFASMTVEDNLALGAFRRARGAQSALDDVFRRFPRLFERSAQLAATLSGGERQMLALGRALMSRPRLLLLDEPSLGLAPLVVREIYNVIADLKSAGVAILLVEQNARAALQVADYGYVLETGDVAIEGEAAALAADPRVVDTYLGGGIAAGA